MPVLENDALLVTCDDRWPRLVDMQLKQTGGRLTGCDPQQPFAVELNGRRFGESDLATALEHEGVYATWRIRVKPLHVTLHLRLSLQENEIALDLPKVEESGDFRLQRLYIPDHRLVTGRAVDGDSYLRHLTRRRNWSASWCPGTATYDQWEDFGRVADGTGELGPQHANHACVWNDAVCAAVDCSIRVAPLVCELSADGAVRDGRAGRFSFWSGSHAYRLRGEKAEPLRVRIALLADYNGNGTVDWCDAAAWEGEQRYRPDPRYAEALVYKLMVDNPRFDQPAFTFDDCLEIIRDVHRLSGGLKQVIYLVGWQYQGHDTGYPSHEVVNPRVGGLEAMRRLMARAKDCNAVVSIHGNFDDSYAEHPGHDPELLSREDDQPFVWFTSDSQQLRVFSISHTLAVETGYARKRIDQLLELLPLSETIHLDAHRPYNEVWTEDGGHIDAECEVQRGLIPIKQMLLERGVDITTEDTDDEKRGIYHWVWHQAQWTQQYKTVMTHGRLGSHWRHGLGGGPGLNPRVEAEALGQSFFRTEWEHDTYDQMVDHFYRHWMYAQIIQRKKIVDYQVGDWRFGVRAWLEDDTRVVGTYNDGLQAWYEGIPIARGDSRFLPWRDNVIFIYSRHGGREQWTLPETWASPRHIDCGEQDAEVPVAPYIRARVLTRGGEVQAPPIDVDGGELVMDMPRGLPVRLDLVSAAT